MIKTYHSSRGHCSVCLLGVNHNHVFPTSQNHPKKSANQVRVSATTVLVIPNPNISRPSPLDVGTDLDVNSKLQWSQDLAGLLNIELLGIANRLVVKYQSAWHSQELSDAEQLVVVDCGWLRLAILP